MAWLCYKACLKPNSGLMGNMRGGESEGMLSSAAEENIFPQILKPQVYRISTLPQIFPHPPEDCLVDYLFILCVWVFCLYTTRVQYPHKPEKGIRSPKTGVTNGGEPPGGFQKSRPGPLEEQQPLSR